MTQKRGFRVPYFSKNDQETNVFRDEILMSESKNIQQKNVF